MSHFLGLSVNCFCGVWEKHLSSRHTYSLYVAESRLERNADAPGRLPKNERSEKGVTTNPKFDRVLCRVESSASLGGVWKYRQAADDISIDDLGDDDTDFTDESSLGTPLPDTEMSFFDPLHPVGAVTAADTSTNYSRASLKRV